MQKVRRREWRGWKRLLWLAALLFCMAGFLPSEASAADANAPMQNLEDVYITGFLSNAPEQKLHWRNSESGKITGKYFLLPSGTDIEEVKIYFGVWDKSAEAFSYDSTNGYVTIDGKQYHSGDTLLLPESGNKLVFTYGSGITADVGIKKSANIPSMFIQTESGSMQAIDADKDKKTKEKGDILIIRDDGTVDYQGAMKQIKGRGNATWQLPKKPYNIKLSESANLLGMGKAKGWCLLANYLDTSLLRNKIIYNLAEETGISFTMDSRSVDLYLNGEYAGTYLITEKVEIDKNRVNITDLEKATEKANVPLPGEEEVDLELYSAGGTAGYSVGTRKWRNIPENPKDITGGYLIELELKSRYEAEACGFVTSRGQAVTMKAPEFVSEEQINYIADFYQKMEDAIYSKDGCNADGDHFSKFIDEESMAKMYLIQEYCMNLDSGITSFYLYKDSDLTGDGKLHMAPVWDFDIAFGNHQGRYNISLTNPEGWWANQAPIYELYEAGDFKLNLMAQAVQHDSVKKLVVEQWNEVFCPAVRAVLENNPGYVPAKVKTFTQYQEELSASAEMNFLVWTDALNHIDTGVYQAGNDFASSAQYVKNFMTARERFMDDALKYGAADGYERLTGTVAIEGNMKVGETLTAEVSDSNGQKFTYQWMADGEKIEGAVEASYVLTEAEAGKEISVAVRDEDGTYLADIKATASERVEGVEPEKPGPDEPGPDEPDPGNTDKPSDETPDKPGQQTPITEQPEVKAPVKLAASAVTKVKSTKNGVKIQFTKVENAASYEIYRKAGSTYTKLGSTKALSYTDKEPVGGKKVFYAVKAISGDAAKYTDADYGTEKEIQLPKAPQKVKAKAQKGRKVLLSWKKVKGASAYLIYRADSKKGTYKLVGKVKKANTVKFTDSKKLKKGRKYYYKVAVLQKGKYSPLGKAVKGSVKE